MSDTKKLKSESDVLREICEMLKNNKYFFWRTNNVPIFGRAMPKFAMRGVPDIIVVHKGRFVGLEVKREGSDTERELNGRKVRQGLLTPEQSEFGVKCAIAGGVYACVRSVHEARQELIMQNLWEGEIL